MGGDSHCREEFPSHLAHLQTLLFLAIAALVVHSKGKWKTLIDALLEDCGPRTLAEELEQFLMSNVSSLMCTMIMVHVCTCTMEITVEPVAVELFLSVYIATKRN